MLFGLKDKDVVTPLRESRRALAAMENDPFSLMITRVKASGDMLGGYEFRDMT